MTKIRIELEIDTARKILQHLASLPGYSPGGILGAYMDRVMQMYCEEYIPDGENQNIKIERIENGT